VALLQIENLHTYYGHVHALKGLELEVEEGEIVSLIGANGAGKTTTLRTVSGLIDPREGRIVLGDEDITETPAHRIVEAGISHAPEGREIFSTLTVNENLNMGAYVLGGDTQTIEKNRRRVFDLVVFPYNGYHCILDREARLQALCESSRLLVEDGLYCMEVSPFLAARPEERNALRYDRTESGGARLVEDVSQDLESDQVVFGMRYSWPDGSGRLLELRLARLSADQVLEEVVEAGLEPLETWGDYDRSPWEQDSPRMLLLARGGGAA